MSTVIMTTLENGKATSVVVEKSGTAVKVNGEAATVDSSGTVLSPKGTPYTVTNGWPSELESFLHSVVGKDQGKANPNQSEGDKETRQQFTLTHGQHIDIPMPTKRTVYELNRPDSRVEVAIHVKGASGKVRVQLAGATSGAVVGGAALGGIAGTTMEGTLDSYDKTVTASGVVDVNLRLDGGDQKVLLILTPA